MAGIYIHIPFCKRKCPYCNFYSSASMEYMDRYVAALTCELEQRKDYLLQPVQTIYFGGGSPSLLAVRDVEHILNQIARHYPIDQSPEITLEANPDDLSLPMLKGIKAAGINRLSLGIQSLYSRDLHYLERQHSTESAFQALEQANIAGFDNVSADLIYGIPGQTTSMLRENVNRLMEYPVKHISAYAITAEENTPLMEYIRTGKKEGPSPDLAASHFFSLSRYLKSLGMEHYEVSNYAFPGNYARHNSNYWVLKPYLGAGPSAHSYNESERQWNVASLDQYISGVGNGKAMEGKEVLTEQQKFNEYIMLRLRTSAGIDLQDLARRFGPQRHNFLIRRYGKMPAKGLIMLYNNYIRLTDKGLFQADGLAEKLFED